MGDTGSVEVNSSFVNFAHLRRRKCRKLKHLHLEYVGGMDLSGVRLVVCDMDGSLLNPAHKISARFEQQLTQLTDRGIRFVAASGRQYESMVEKLGGDAAAALLIAENGAYVRDGQHTLLTTTLPAEGVTATLDAIAARTDIHAVLCSASGAFASARSAEFLTYLQEYYTRYQAVDDLYSVREPILKIALFYADNSERHIYPLVKHLRPQIQVKISSQRWVDVSHPNAHKGHAVALVQERLGVGPAETMAFGDYLNDLEMLRRARFSFAMANAHPELKAAAAYQTASNAEQGVEQVLAQLLV